MIAVQTKLVAFDRRLANAQARGQDRPLRTETEMAAHGEAAYRRGVDATRALADQQLVDLRASLAGLTEGIFSRLEAAEPELLAQVQAGLPVLAVEIARRLLAGYEPPAEAVAKICEQTLAELLPEREGLELVLSPRDSALLEQLQPAWRDRYPGLQVRIDPSFQPGDCQVRSRFGLTDARLNRKLAALQREMGTR